MDVKAALGKKGLFFTKFRSGASSGDVRKKTFTVDKVGVYYMERMDSKSYICNNNKRNIKFGVLWGGG